LLLKSYLSEFDILNFSAIFFGQFPVIAFETYALLRKGKLAWENAEKHGKKDCRSKR
jgi:hypothetical protein